MKRFVSGFLALCAALAACSRQQIATPTRALDRPSDVALFCVDFEFDLRAPERGPMETEAAYRGRLQVYLENACQGTAPVETTPAPTAAVLAPEECDGPHRQRRIEARRALALVEARKAAERLGLPPRDNPCCPADTPDCGIFPSEASRRKLLALVTNTGRGEVAVVDTQARVSGLNTYGEIQNLQSGKPGFGFLPAGRLPLHVRAVAPATRSDEAGRRLAPSAWAVTSNAGSCDLSVVDLQAVAELVSAPGDCDERSCPRRIAPFVTDPGRPLGARPAWVEAAPWGEAERRALVAFPNCGLVGEVDLRTGRLVEGVAFDGSGAARTLTAAELAAVRCPADCGGGGGELMPGMDVPGAAREPGQPMTLAVDREGRRIVIGDGAGSALTIVPYRPGEPDGQRLGAPRQLLLEEPVLTQSPSQRGVEVLRVSPRTAAGLFAYAVARDGTVRVVDLDREVECETNPDPRYLQRLAAEGAARVLPDELNEQNLRRLACFPVGTTPRSPLNTSPGIPLPGGALPRDVAFVRLDLPCDPAEQSCPWNPATPPEEWIPAAPSVWVGDFAWILGSNGAVQAVQIADYCPGPSFRACFPEQGVARRAALLSTRSVARPNPELDDLPALPQAAALSPVDRLGNSRRPLVSRLSDRDPGPRVETGRPGEPPYTVRVPGTFSASATAPDPDAPAGSGQTRLALPAPAEYYYLPTDPVCGLVLSEALMGRQGGEPAFRPRTIAAFPDPLAVRNETWVLEWEGIVPGTARQSGLLVPSGALLDLGGLYCNRGVEPGDKLWLPGCQRNQDCPGGVCVREQAQGGAPGLCLPSASQGEACRAESQLLTVDRPAAGTETTIWAATWLRRYRIVKVEQQRPLSYPLVPISCDAARPCPAGLRCNRAAGEAAGTCEASDTMDRLTLAEIAEPEFSAEQQRCEELAYGEACGDSAAVNVQLRGAPACDERTPCPYGWRCDASRGRCDVPLADRERPVTRRTTCRADLGDEGKIVKRCVLECESSQDCGAGFVCAHSIYEAAEGGLGRGRPRCLRAPLIAEGVPISDGSGVRPMTRRDAERVLRACFADPVAYQVRAGDAFLVRGFTSSAPVMERVAPDGTCQRPQPGDPAYAAARLRQPRLRLGPRESLGPGDPRRCPAEPAWISHRLPTLQRTASCAEALQAGRVRMPNGVELRVAPQPDPRAPDADEWLRREYELLSSLPLDRPGLCVLSDAAEEGPNGTCADGTAPPCPRRIHFENPYLNLVLRLPRRLEPLLLDGRAVRGAEWAVPPEGYTIAFNVVGGYRPYALNAEVPAGQRAQGLRAAAQAPDGAVFIVDEGRTGSATGLRGQLMRIFRVGMDESFLVR